MSTCLIWIRSVYGETCNIVILVKILSKQLIIPKHLQYMQNADINQYLSKQRYRHTHTHTKCKQIFVGKQHRYQNETKRCHVLFCCRPFFLYFSCSLSLLPEISDVAKVSEREILLQGLLLHALYSQRVFTLQSILLKLSKKNSFSTYSFCILKARFILNMHIQS